MTHTSTQWGVIQRAAERLTVQMRAELKHSAEYAVGSAVGAEQD